MRRLSERTVSNQSIITIIEKFVKSVNTMEDTILIPSKLMDKQVGDSVDDSIRSSQKNNDGISRGVRDNFSNTDLLNLYNTLTSAKSDLIWGIKNQNGEDGVVSCQKVNGSPVESSSIAVVAEQQQQTPQNVDSNARNMGHVRCPSTVSVSSSNSGSSTISDYETEVSSNDNDSGVESEGKKKKNNCQELEEKFRFHLIELQKSLESMTETANYLILRYSDDVGSEHC
jgi:hypothetical protein